MRIFTIIFLIGFPILCFSQEDNLQDSLNKFEGEGDYHFMEKRYEIAIKYFDKALNIDSLNSYTYFCRGAAKKFLKNYTGAIADFTKAIKYLPKEKSGWWISKSRSVKMGDKYWVSSKTTSYQYKYYYAFWYRAESKYFMNDYLGAISDLNTVIVYEKNDAGLFLQLGICKTMLKKYSEGKLALDKCILLDANNAESYRLRGICNYNLNFHEAGCLDFSKAGELGDEEAYNLIKQYCH